VDGHGSLNEALDEALVHRHVEPAAFIAEPTAERSPENDRPKTIDQRKKA
jgi:hypothetical protein